jgi:CubicO group peptidase (beta-lactamase class C family)
MGKGLPRLKLVNFSSGYIGPHRAVRVQVPVTTDSVFQVGSITKLWTATMIMQLVDEGLLSLDTTVSEVLLGRIMLYPAEPADSSGTGSCSARVTTSRGHRSASTSSPTPRPTST